MPEQWLVWSNEHGKWWGPNGGGYTTKRSMAGRYTLEKAADICSRANSGLKDNQPPDETMLLDV